MKKRNGLGQIILPLMGLSLFLAVISCEKDENKDKDMTQNQTRYYINGDANGSQEVPPDTSLATGIISGTFSADSNMLHYSITWTGLSGDVTAAHFHGPADSGVAAAPLIDIPINLNGINGTTSGSVNLPDSTEAFLLEGKIYYNLHTSMYPDGEIRGQISTTQY